MCFIAQMNGESVGTKCGFKQSLHEFLHNSKHASHPIYSTASTQSPSLTVPVVGRGEGRHDDVPPVDVDDVGDGLEDVEVEVRVSGDGAVEAGLEKGRPLLLQHALGPAAVVLTHPGHPWKHHLTGGQTHRQQPVHTTLQT